jgi:methyl-accepting chemotaxis protein
MGPLDSAEDTRPTHRTRDYHRPMQPANVEAPRRALWRLIALDMSFVISGVIGWATVGSIEARVLAVVFVVRGLGCYALFWRLLEPVRRWVAAGDAADDRTVLESDDIVQRKLGRFYVIYPVGWVVAIAIASAITVAFPSLGVVPANAERVTIALGAVACATLSYAFIFVLLSPITHELVVGISAAVKSRSLVPARPERSLALELRGFVTSLVAGMLCVATVIGGKARIDAIRARTIADQTSLAALAVVELHSGRTPDQPGLRIVDVIDLPDQLREHIAGRRGGAFDPARELVVAGVAIDEQRWVIARAEPDERLLEFIGLMSIVTAIMSAIAYFSAIGLGRILLGPIVELRAATRTMVATGQLRALGRAAPQHNDELGALVSDFNHMLDMLDELAVVASAVSLGDLSVEIERPGDLHDGFRVMVERLHEVVERLRDTALDVAAATSEIHASMLEHDVQATRLALDVERASDGAHALAEAATGISVAAGEVLEFAEHTAAANGTMAEHIDELDRQAKGVGELLKLLGEIADRSDLIALNGSLEAVRVGEAGRGFALVAGEMRRLAERVTRTIDDARVHVTNIEQAGTDVATVMSQSRAFASQTARAARAITKLTKEQSESASQTAQTSAAMAEFVVMSSASASQISAACQGLREQVTQLERLMWTFKLRDAKPRPSA